jgi:hypothetical protein
MRPALVLQVEGLLVPALAAFGAAPAVSGFAVLAAQLLSALVVPVWV